MNTYLIAPSASISTEALDNEVREWGRTWTTIATLLQTAKMNAVCPNGELWKIDRQSFKGTGWVMTGDLPNIACSPSILVDGYCGFRMSAGATPAKMANTPFTEVPIVYSIIRKNLSLCLFFVFCLCLLLAWFVGGTPGLPTPTLKRLAVADWQPRDSAGEFVFQNKLWILGGWKTDPAELLRDVWNSADGVKWNLVQPKLPFHYTDLPMSIIFKNKIWVMGGTTLSDPIKITTNDIWNSDDGINWNKAEKSAAWSPRTGTPIVEFNGRLWIFGGLEWIGDKQTFKNDVWSSVDGINWEKMTEHAAWEPRAYHGALAYKGKLWVIGGGSYKPGYVALNDVWNSEDGVNWTKVSNAPWHGRIWFSTVVYNDYMWVIGGWSKDTLNSDGIWYSNDGEKWKRLAISKTWRARHEPSTYVFDGKVILAGGHDGTPLTNEVWQLDVPSAWLNLDRIADSALPWR